MSTIQEPTDPAKHPDFTANLIPLQYHDFVPLFTMKGANKLPPHRYMDHEIPLEADEKPCKWGSGLLKSRLCFLTSKNHKQDYKQRGTTTWG